MVEYKKVVLKFGGSVISDEAAIARVVYTIEKVLESYQIVAVVVSAIGKTTNNLDCLAHRVSNSPNPRELDALLATGEMQSAALVSMRLNSMGIPARSYNAMQFGIVTDSNFGNAEIKKMFVEKVNPLYGIPVVAGFQGVNENGDFTTLGREGSDISAVIIGAACRADFCWFFKDGGGIYNKNPKEDADARLYKEISYTKMLELLNQGRGQVLHKRSVQYAQQYKMPLFVSGMTYPYTGTWIKELVHPKVY